MNPIDKCIDLAESTWGFMSDAKYQAERIKPAVDARAELAALRAKAALADEMAELLPYTQTPGFADWLTRYRAIATNEKETP